MPDNPVRNATSTAYEASRVVSNGPAAVYGLTGYNSKASTQFIQLHDAASLPSDGAVPFVILSVAATSTFSLDLGPYGRTCRNGIVICNSSTGPTKTIGSADCFWDIQYD